MAEIYYLMYSREAHLFEDLILLVSPALCSACQIASHSASDVSSLGKESSIQGGHLVPFWALTP